MHGLLHLALPGVLGHQHVVRHVLGLATAAAPLVVRKPRAHPVADGFGERLKLAMADAAVANPELARAAGVHRFTVTFWRSGKQRPHPLAIRIIARTLGVRAAWLRTGAAPMRPARSTRPASAVVESPREAWIRAELAAYADAGVAPAEIDAAACLFRTPRTHALYAPADASAPLEGLRVVAAHARAVLRARGYPIPATPPV